MKLKGKRLAALLGAVLFSVGTASSALAASAEPEASPLAAGFLHSAIIKEDGTLWTAGSNTYGQLGVEAPAEGEASSEGEGSETAAASGGDSTVFVQVKNDMRAVYAGYLNTFAIDNGGMLYGWGWNEGGQLGLGDTENRTVPAEILNDTVTAAPGRFHTAAITRDGTLWLWGWNSKGQLGNGSTESMNAPKETLDQVKSVAVGIEHTMAVKADHTLWAAGRNSYCQKSDGTTQEHMTCQQVSEQ